MVTRKRKIENTRDKFGAFEIGSADRSAFRPETIEVLGREQERASRAQTYAPRSHANTTTEIPEVIYSGREAEGSYVLPEQARTRKSTSLSEEDLMPSIKTMSYAEPKKKVDSREKLEGKTKVMLAVYMFIVVVLAAVVIGTGIVINTIGANIENLNAEIESSNSVVASQSEQLALLNDYYHIAGVAKDPNGLNMEEIVDGSQTQIDLIPFVEPEQPAELGWFDRFSDWVQGVLGGN